VNNELERDEKGSGHSLFPLLLRNFAAGTEVHSNVHRSKVHVFNDLSDVFLIRNYMKESVALPTLLFSSIGLRY
jgi:hypothetical protein